MANEARIAPDDHRYAAETQRRIGEVVRGVFAIRRCGETDIDGVIGRLREQAKASRGAGFRGIARLCTRMVDCLLKGRSDPRWSASAGATCSNACETIQLHADAVTRGLIRTGDNNESGQDTRSDGKADDERAGLPDAVNTPSANARLDLGEPPSARQVQHWRTGAQSRECCSTV